MSRRTKAVHADSPLTLLEPGEIYTPSWTRLSPIRTRRPDDFSWVVFTNETSSLSDQIVATLRSEGVEPLCIPSWAQGAVDRGYLTEVFRAAWTERRWPTRILYLWSLLDEPLSKETHQQSLDTALSAAALARTVDQAIQSSYQDQDCVTLRLTNYAMRVTGYEAFQAERALLTLTSERASEGANIRRRSVDVIAPARGTELEKELVASILTEAMTSSVGSGAVAIRGGIWRWLRQSDWAPIGAGDRHLSVGTEAGNYLIVGDTSSIELTFAYQLACAGAGSLVIRSPCELPPREQWDALVEGSPETDAAAQWLWQIRVIEELGCEVRVLTIDPDKIDELPKAVRQLCGRSISGVFYVTDAATKSKLDAQNVLRIRARRLASLHDALTDMSFGFMVMLATMDPPQGDTHSEELDLLGTYQEALAISASSGKRRVASIVCRVSPDTGGRSTNGLHWYEVTDSVWQILRVGLTQASLTIRG
jgi:hypothetical protein